jgi:phosphohistidine swiveling domain-containing protein
LEWLLGYPAALQAGPAVVGGKGWNLARLDHFGFPVPRGGVLVAEAHRHFLRHGEVSTEVIDALTNFLSTIGLVSVSLAVRSSATAEDGPTTSFAGIHESVLNVVGVEATLAAIHTCYRSLEAPKARAYRERMGLPDDTVHCAVVLCAMVPTVVAAGVTFTADPRSGRRDRVLVSATPGLGEALVGGRIYPEEVEIDTARYTLVQRSGPRVLTTDQYGRLARLGVRIEWALAEGQAPQDVEWAFDGQQFWVVQARPITNLPRPTVRLTSTQSALWTNGNLKDAIAGAPTTSSWSFIGPYLNGILFAPFTRIGYPVPNGMDVVRRFDGRAYLDLATLQAIYFDALGALPSEANKGLGGPTVEIPLPEVTPELRRRWQRFRLRLIGLLIRESRHYGRAITQVRAAARTYSTRSFSDLSNTQLIGIAEEIAELQLAFGPTFQLGNMAAGFSSQVLTQVLARVLPGKGEALSAALMAGSGDVVSAEHGYRLFDLAAVATRDPAARVWLETQSSQQPMRWRDLPPSSAFRQAFAAFLDEFGHRGVYEAELANPRWNEDPSFLLAQIRMLLADGVETVESRRGMALARRRQAEAALDSLLLPVRLIVGWLAGQTRHAAARREAGKSALIALAEPVRGLFLEFGRRMVAAGVLAESNDVFHLARADLEAFVRGEWDGVGAATLVAERRLLRVERLASSPPADLIESVARDALRVARSPAPPTRNAKRVTRNSLSGVAASSGQATGPACILQHPSEAGRLRRGDVLVAPSTDPGWTPLFLRAAALVTEVGGYLSHGAIVAREFGIPAVVNVPDALTLIRDGEPVLVDGDSGQVVRYPALQESRHATRT